MNELHKWSGPLFFLDELGLLERDEMHRNNDVRAWLLDSESPQLQPLRNQHEWQRHKAATITAPSILQRLRRFFFEFR